MNKLFPEVDISRIATEVENPDLINKLNTTRDSLRKNILHILTDDQNVEVLRCVLHKVDKGLINEKSASGQTPICFGLTAKTVNEDFFLELLSHDDCDVTIPDKRHLTPLHYAVFNGEHRIAHRILQHGANVDAKSITGRTPLYLAVENNDYEMASMLLYYNADVTIECEEIHNRDMTSSLLQCIDRDFLGMAELLLDYVDVNDPSSNGETLLYRAIQNASQITYRILERGANINHRYGRRHCIMALRKIPGPLTKKTFFEHLWPMIDIKYMMKYCPNDLYELFFEHNLLSDQFFASLFVDYDIEDTYSFAKFFLACDLTMRFHRGIDLVTSKTEESVLGLFCSMLLVCNEVTGQLVHSVLYFYGFGKLFWTFVDVNVEVIDDTNTIQHDFILSTFLFDDNILLPRQCAFWRNHYAPTYNELDDSDLALPSLTELSRTVVRQSCRRIQDLKDNRLFAFINRIKTIGLPKICEDILLLRRSIYHS